MPHLLVRTAWYFPVSTPANPRTATFDILARHESAEAEDVLLKAFESEDEESRQLAAATIVKRPGQHRLLEIIRRVDSLDETACAEFSLSPERFNVALNQCFDDTEDDSRSSAVEFIRRTTNFSQLHTLFDQLQDTEDEYRKSVTTAIHDLTDQLSLRIRTDDESVLPTFDLESLQTHQRLIIEDLAARTRHDLSEEHILFPVLRSLLILGRADEEAVLAVLSRRGSVYPDASVRVLSEETNPAIFDLLCESLVRHAPPATVIKTFNTRKDFDFLLHFLNWLPESPDGYLKRNLARLDNVTWLDHSNPIVQQLPSSVHNRLVALANLVRIDDECRLELKTWIVRQSDAAGRNAASDVLDSLPTETVQAILHEALEDEDPGVEAWATRRLRTQKLPDTFEALVTRLDKQLPLVRDAARGELDSFDLHKFLELFPGLSPAHCVQCGQALLKINPETPDELLKEMTHPFCRRRIRAIRAADAMGLTREVYSGIIDALSDSEPGVRCIAIETLGKTTSHESIEAIQEMTDDESRAVRDTANRVLARLAEKLTTTRNELQTQPAL